MLGLILLFSSIDTVKYDDGIPESFYVGNHIDDKFATRFSIPYAPCKILGILVFANNPDGFTYGALCQEQGGTPCTLNTWIEKDSIYSEMQEWKFTPMEIEISDAIPVWFILKTGNYPGIGGDTNNPSGNSYYYSISSGWQQTQYNWLIRLVVQKDNGYYEDFLKGKAGYTGNWAFGRPLFIPPRDSCFGTQLDSLYAHNIKLTLESPWITLTDYSISNPILRCRHFYKTEIRADGGNVKISHDAINWQLITPTIGYDTMLMDSIGQDWEPGFSGDSYGWNNVYFLLPSYDSLKIKWQFISDGYISDLGWFVDEVGIAERLLHDVSTTAINFQKFVPSNTQLTPQVTIKNLGVSEETNFFVKCEIESSETFIYQEEILVDVLPPDSIIETVFPQWNVGKKGVVYTIRTYTELIDDENQANDTLTAILKSFPLIKSIRAEYTNIAPSIDGIIDSLEWQNAALVDGSDVIGVDFEDSSDACILYFMYDTSNFYIGAKIDKPQEFRVYMDDINDKKWGPNEGFYWITNDGAGFYDMYYSSVFSLPGSLFAISDSGVEITIPAGNSPYEFSASESLGCFIYATIASNKNLPAPLHPSLFPSPPWRDPAMAGLPSSLFTRYVGWWPQTVPFTSYTNPEHYGKIILEEFAIEETSNSQLTISNYQLSIYPNPSTGGKVEIRFQMPEPRHPTSDIRHPTSNISLTIYDLSGRLVKSFPLTPNPLSLTTALKSGIYFIVYNTLETKIIKKFVVVN